MGPCCLFWKYISSLATLLHLCSQVPYNLIKTFLQVSRKIKIPISVAPSSGLLTYFSLSLVFFHRWLLLCRRFWKQARLIVWKLLLAGSAVFICLLHPYMDVVDMEQVQVPAHTEAPWALQPRLLWHLKMVMMMMMMMMDDDGCNQHCDTWWWWWMLTSRRRRVNMICGRGPVEGGSWSGEVEIGSAPLQSVIGNL